MTEYKLAIDYNTDITISDIANERTLDVTSLKQDNPGAPVRKHVDHDEAEDERDGEIAAIEAFIAQHGVKRPTEEDFIPKKCSWGGKSKAQKLAENPAYIERRGRRRTTFSKDVTFVVVDGGEYKRAGRGRAKLGETRQTFTIHFSNVEKVSEGTFTSDYLQSLARV